MSKIIHFAILLAVIISLNVFSVNCWTCGISSEAQGVIIGGSSLAASQRGHYPWVAALISEKENSYFCGGVLISNSVVITAAHCMLPKGERTQLLPRDVNVLLGVYDLSDPFEVGRFSSAINEIRVHPKWNPSILRYESDVALLTSAETIPFNSFIQPICLTKPKPDSDILSIKTGTVVGYGISSPDSKKSESIPRILNVPIHNNEDCFLHNKELAGISTHKTFCAGTGTGSGVCLGDSGSGLFVKYGDTFYLRGIVSASLITAERNCDVNDYAIFTSVSDYIDWMTHDDIFGPREERTTSCNGCEITRTGQAKACNLCTFIAGGSSLFGECNGCTISKESGPMWIGICFGCEIKNCFNCNFGFENATTVLGINIHRIEICNGCIIEECQGCLIGEFFFYRG